MKVDTIDAEINGLRLATHQHDNFFIQCLQCIQWLIIILERVLTEWLNYVILTYVQY